MEVHLSKLGEMAKAREGWRAAVRGVTESDTTEQPNNNKNRSQDGGSGTLGGRSRKHSGFLGRKDLESQRGQGDWRALWHSMPPFLGGRGPWSQAKDESQPCGLPLVLHPCKGTQHPVCRGSHGSLGSVHRGTHPDRVWSLPLTGQYCHAAGVMRAEKGHSLNPPIVHPDS